MENQNNNLIEEKAMQNWFNILKPVLSIPSVIVDRKKFLIKELTPYCDKKIIDDAITTTPQNAGISKSTVDKIANGVIKYHTNSVTLISYAAGIPGGIWMIGTILADLAQYYFHILQVVQKLAYIYGWPDFFKEKIEMDDETLYIITLFIGVMRGDGLANNALKIISEKLAKEVAERLPRLPLTKYIVYKAAKQVAKWLGQKLTKQTFGRFVSKAIPILSALTSGILTFATFKSQCIRLKNHLSELPLAC